VYYLLCYEISALCYSIKMVVVMLVESRPYNK
jgi:hypothetical protein